MNEREYRRLLQQIEDDYRRKKDALELVFKMSQDTSNGVPAGEAPIKRGTIDTLVRGVLPQMQKQFSPRDVMDRIQQLPDVPAGLNRSSVSSALKRMADEGLIAVVELGRGKRASRYRARANGNGKEATPPEPPEPLAEPEPNVEPPMEPITDDDIPF